MPYGAQLPVRLEPEVDSRLEEIAQRAGTTKSAFIRLLAKTFVDQVMDEDGKVNLPPDWSKLLLPQADRRSSSARATKKVSSTSLSEVAKKSADAAERALERERRSQQR